MGMCVPAGHTQGTCPPVPVSGALEAQVWVWRGCGLGEPTSCRLVLGASWPQRLKHVALGVGGQHCPPALIGAHSPPNQAASQSPSCRQALGSEGRASWSSAPWPPAWGGRTDRVCFSEQQTRLPTEDGGGAEVGEAPRVRKQGHQIFLFLLQQETSGVCDARDGGLGHTSERKVWGSEASGLAAGPLRAVAGCWGCRPRHVDPH